MPQTPKYDLPHVRERNTEIHKKYKNIIVFDVLFICSFIVFIIYLLLSHLCFVIYIIFIISLIYLPFLFYMILHCFSLNLGRAEMCTCVFKAHLTKAKIIY